MMNPWGQLRGLPRPVWLLFSAILINRAGTMVLPFMVLYLTRSLGLPPGRAALSLTQTLSKLRLMGRVSTYSGWYDADDAFSYEGTNVLVDAEAAYKFGKHTTLVLGGTICRSQPSSTAACPSFDTSSLNVRMTRRSSCEPGAVTPAASRNTTAGASTGSNRKYGMPSASRGRPITRPSRSLTGSSWRRLFPARSTARIRKR